MLKKCLIANRGEIAVRVIRGCREMGIISVAVYSDADAQAQHTQLADEAYAIGAAPPQQSYLHSDTLLEVARRAGCDSVHPGYGFLSENADFARAVMDAGLVWVGPPPEAIEAMGVKTTARTLMQEAGVPVVPGYQGDKPTDEQLQTAAADIGYPVMVKAAGGGGGKGIRIVRDPDALLEAVSGARSEAQKAFNDGRVFLEKYIEHGRHIEIQILADTHSNIVHLGERECSTQRRHQKIIEESPSPMMTPALRAEMGAAAIAAAEAVGYVNAGTVEFIATDIGDFYFLEMNTRLQVEHPVTEMVTGVDLVQAQLQVAGGAELPFTQADISQNGHAIECRIYAEDARNNFLPAIGTVQRFEPAYAPGVRVDSGIQSGDTITIHYDPMIAKLIVHAQTRTAAIQRMQQTLHDSVILGTTTNVDFLQTLLADDTFIQGAVTTRYVDDNLHDLLPEQPELPPMALIAAALNDAKGTVTQMSSVASNNNDGDMYSPWDRADNFRLSE